MNEVYQHTYQETLSRTESTIGGPQHPAYEIQLTGTGDLVLTDLTVPTSALQLSGELAGRFSVRNRQDRLVAEFTKPEGDTLKLALPSGAYTIRLDDDLEIYGDSDNVKTARIELTRNAQLYLTKRDFSSNGLEFTRFRGNLKKEDKDEKYVFALLPGLDYPSLDANDLVRVQVGMLGSIAPQLSGVQASCLFNITGQESEGIQASEIFNLAEDDFQGIQAAGVFNITEGQMEGLQASGVFNISDDSMSGIQSSGLFNIAGDYFSGIQTAGTLQYPGQTGQRYPGGRVIQYRRGTERDSGSRPVQLRVLYARGAGFCVECCRNHAGSADRLAEYQPGSIRPACRIYQSVPEWDC